MSPLYKLLHNNNVQINWNKQCQETYDTIKRDITSNQVLFHYSLQLLITADASHNLVAGVLSHKIDDLKSMCSISRGLSKSKKFIVHPIKKHCLFCYKIETSFNR